MRIKTGERPEISVHLAMAGYGQGSVSCRQDLVLGMDATPVNVNIASAKHASCTVRWQCTSDNGKSLFLKCASIFVQIFQIGNSNEMG